VPDSDPTSCRECTRGGRGKRLLYLLRRARCRSCSRGEPAKISHNIAELARASVAAPDRLTQPSSRPEAEGSGWQCAPASPSTRTRPKGLIDKRECSKQPTQHQRRGVSPWFRSLAGRQSNGAATIVASRGPSDLDATRADARRLAAQPGRSTGRRSGSFARGAISCRQGFDDDDFNTSAQRYGICIHRLPRFRAQATESSCAPAMREEVRLS
jgi:hypothetical protein